MTKADIEQASGSWLSQEYRREMSIQDIFEAGAKYGKSMCTPVCDRDLDTPAGKAALTVWNRIPAHLRQDRHMTESEFYMFVKGFKFLFKRNSK